MIGGGISLKEIGVNFDHIIGVRIFSLIIAIVADFSISGFGFLESNEKD
jgi:hypothetical protein